MKALWIVGGLIGIAIALATGQSRLSDMASAQSVVDLAPLECTLSPTGSIKQGSIVLLTCREKTQAKSADKGSRLLKIVFAGKSLAVFPQSSGEYQGVIGLSVDTPIGASTVAVFQSGVDKPLALLPLTVVDGKFQRQNITVSKATKGLQPLPGELEAIQALKETISPVRYWSGSFVAPTPDCMNSPFGVKRYHNGVYTHDYHKGVDLRSPQGRPIKAINDGVVKIAAPHFRLHGGTVGIDHGQGLGSVYIHMSKVLVKTGQIVKKGEPIGLVGSTGFATGPHLHWGLYAGGFPVNPSPWIRSPWCQ